MPLYQRICVSTCVTFAIRYAKPSGELALIFGGEVLGDDMFSFAVVADCTVMKLRAKIFLVFFLRCLNIKLLHIPGE